MNDELLNNKLISISTHRQGSDEWLHARVGLITGSQVFKLMTGAEDKLSAGSQTYCRELASDIIAGQAKQTYQSDAMSRGTELEPIARFRMIERFEENNPLDPIGIKEVGFITNSDWPGCGVSLVGVTSDRGIAEIKCRGRELHLAHLLGIDKKTVYQMQFGMAFTGGTHGYFGAYSDEFKQDEGDLITHMIKRDEDMIELMKAKCIQARLFIDAKVKQYRKLIADQVS